MMDLSVARAEVIEKFINIEWLMNAIISQHYFGKVRSDFTFEFLYDEYCSFALKRRVVLKACPSLLGKTENSLNRLNTIRNYFAHVGQHIIEGPAPVGPSRIPDPRNHSKSVDFEALRTEFLGLENAVVATLVEQYKAKGGQLVTEQT